MAKKAQTKDSLRFNAWTLGPRGADVFEKSVEALELERLNPLRGVDEWRLGQIFDDARDGVFADLAWLYNEIEGVEPALLSCCDARESAASECGWLVKTTDANRVRGFDETLANEQRDALLAAFGSVDDDLAELAEHLVSAFFRGAAHARPLWNEDGSLAGFQHLDLWNFALDKKSGVWYWNADASRDERSFQPIPPGELVSLAVTRHVDHAALPIFIRAALGAKRYGVWLDRFGIPPVGIIMPPSAEKGEQAAYMDLARKFARGGSGILPNASQIVYGTEARAVCPFTDFIRFQQQQIYTVGLGRVQSGETDAANLGGNAAGVVENGFQRIVRRDARRIARAINDGVTRKILAQLFPGRPVLAQFAWDTEAKRTSREVLEDAGLARNAGLAIDLDQLQEMTGYRLSKAPETPVQSPFGGLNSHAPEKTALQTHEKPLQNAPSASDGQGDAKGSRALLEAFSRDLGPAAEAVKSFLDVLDNGEAVSSPLVQEKASALLADLPSLLPEDPALAAVIAEAMAAEFNPDGRARTPAAPQNGEATNADECRAKDPAHCRTHGTPRKSAYEAFLERERERAKAELPANISKADEAVSRYEAVSGKWEEGERMTPSRFVALREAQSAASELRSRAASIKSGGDEQKAMQLFEKAGQMEKATSKVHAAFQNDPVYEKFSQMGAEKVAKEDDAKWKFIDNFSRKVDDLHSQYIKKLESQKKVADVWRKIEAGMNSVLAEATNADDCRAEDPAHCRTHGTPEKPATPEAVKRFLADPPARISPDMADALLSAGFDDRDGDGNTVKYGSLLKDHLERESHSEKDRIARKERLGEAVKVIRASKPMPSKNPEKPNERVYSGLSNGKAYIGVADEHGELNAIVMVSYRRDRANDE